MTLAFYVIISRASYWPRMRLSFARRDPRNKLKAGQVAVRINLNFDDNLFDPPTFPIEVRPENVIRPEVKVSTESAK